METKSNLKLFFAILLLLASLKSFAQTDTLNVYLEKNQDYRTGVDLVFENNTNDTIFLYSRFQNFSFRGEIPHHSGINIDYFYDGKPFAISGKEPASDVFIFSKGVTLIYPKSNAKLFFDVGKYLYIPEKSSKKYEVSFFMNYLYGKYLDPASLPTSITYFQTNRVTIVEASEEED